MARLASVLETPNGQWKINGDGTVTSVAHRLTWMQVPYGMRWDGRRYVGQPALMTFREATKRFGLGKQVSDGLAGRGTIYSEEDMAISGCEAIPSTGKEQVVHAGRSDWHLPNAVEMHSLLLLDPNETEPFSSGRGRPGTGWEGRIETLKQIVPGAWATARNKYEPLEAWTACWKYRVLWFGRFDVAWGARLGTGVLFDFQANQSLGVLLVCQARG